MKILLVRNYLDAEILVNGPYTSLCEILANADSRNFYAAVVVNDLIVAPYLTGMIYSFHQKLTENNNTTIEKSAAESIKETLEEMVFENPVLSVRLDLAKKAVSEILEGINPTKDNHYKKSRGPTRAFYELGKKIGEVTFDTNIRRYFGAKEIQQKHVSNYCRYIFDSSSAPIKL